MDNSEYFRKLFDMLPTVVSHHSPETALCRFLKHAVRREIERVFSSDYGLAMEFGPFGKLIFPYHQMGSVDSRNLFDLDELILFSFYYANKGRYKKVLDAGANLGLHSIILSRCGYEVIAYEPDPVHFTVLVDNLKRNNAAEVMPVNKAISTEAGIRQFVRVMGNTTSSHLSGAKPNPYGELEYCNVQTEIFKNIMKGVDLVKMDIEGHEKDVLLSTVAEDWLNTDAIVEVGSAENAEEIFAHFQSISIHVMAQKTGWQRVTSLRDMPISYRDGSLFISARGKMTW